MNSSEVLQWTKEIATRWQNVPSFTTPEQIKNLAIICDGDRRAAQKRGFEPYWGHKAGLEVVRGIVGNCFGWGINTLTFWLWSTENWCREKAQVEFIFKLAEEYLYDQQFLEQLIKNQIRLTHLGRKDGLSKAIEEELRSLELSTVNFQTRRLNLAIDYGGEDELERAFFKVFNDKPQKTNGFLRDYLDTCGQPDVDLVIRTAVIGSELPHTSGFMPLQTSYSAWLFIEELFPDLTPDILQSALIKAGQYQKRVGR